MWSQSTNVTDRQTDDMLSQDRALQFCTKVHCAIKTKDSHPLFCGRITDGRGPHGMRRWFPVRPSIRPTRQLKIRTDPNYFLPLSICLELWSLALSELGYNLTCCGSLANFKPKRIASASRGFLAAARLSCISCCTSTRQCYQHCPVSNQSRDQVSVPVLPNLSTPSILLAIRSCMVLSLLI